MLSQRYRPSTYPRPVKRKLSMIDILAKCSVLASSICDRNVISTPTHGLLYDCDSFIAWKDVVVDLCSY